MPESKLAAPIIAAASSLFGGFASRRSAQEASSRRIQTTVADAQAAGINPLTALGASGHQGADAPQSHAALGAGFQGVSRAIMQGQAQSIRADVQQKHLQNDALRLQLEKQRQANVVRSISSGARTAAAEGHALGTRQNPLQGHQWYRLHDGTMVVFPHRDIGEMFSDSKYGAGLGAGIIAAQTGNPLIPPREAMNPAARRLYDAGSRVGSKALGLGPRAMSVYEAINRYFDPKEEEQLPSANRLPIGRPSARYPWHRSRN